MIDVNICFEISGNTTLRPGDRAGHPDRVLQKILGYRGVSLFPNPMLAGIQPILPGVDNRRVLENPALIQIVEDGSDAGQLKVGSFTRSESMVKWNELLRIERELSPQRGLKARVSSAAYDRALLRWAFSDS